jgi:myo-inositol catabolism protein IolC
MEVIDRNHGRYLEGLQDIGYTRSVGRTLWADALDGLLRGALSRSDLSKAVAHNYCLLITAHNRGRRAHALSGHLR